MIATTGSRNMTDALTALGAAFATQGWLLATGGNLSARNEGEDRFTITASGGDKGALTPNDFVDVRLDDAVQLSGARRPSAETVVHAAIYRATDARFVAHVHAPYCTLVSRRDADLGGVTFTGWEYVKALGFWAEGATVVTPIVANHAALDRLGTAVGRSVSDVPGVLVAGHGLYAWGATAPDVKRHVEAFEALCRLSWEWEANAVTRTR